MEVWEQHPLLYHYTRHAGLQGILETQALHATHYKYLNDAFELLHMKPKLIETITPAMQNFIEDLAKTNRPLADKLARDGGPNKTAEHDAIAVVETLYKVTLGINRPLKFFEPYIASFCAHNKEYEKQNGLLSQWRAYGRDSGYAIIFDTRKLCELVMKVEMVAHPYASAGFGDVIYEGDDEGFNKEFGALVKATVGSFPNFLPGNNEVLTDLYTSFTASIPRYKHKGFSEEQEVRLVVSPLSPSSLDHLKKTQPADFEKVKNKSPKRLSFKERFVPYIIVFDEAQVTLPIERIIVGPHQDKLARADRLRHYLELREITAEVSCSETPLIC